VTGTLMRRHDGHDVKPVTDNAKACPKTKESRLQVYD
jgi:hypothetical protein